MESLLLLVDLLMKSFKCMGFALALCHLLELTTKISPRACLHNCKNACQWLWRAFTQQILFIVWFLSVLETCTILFIELLFLSWEDTTRRLKWVVFLKALQIEQLSVSYGDVPLEGRCRALCHSQTWSHCSKLNLPGMVSRVS